MTKALFCGDREWTDKTTIKAVMVDMATAAYDKLCVCEGDCRGADRIAGAVADEMGLAHCKFPANWGFFRRAAGPMRNGWMLEYFDPHIVVAFHRDITISKGTKDIVNKAVRAGKIVKVIGSGVEYTDLKEEIE